MTRYANNTSGFRGVSFHKRTGKWQAYISVNRKQFHIGLYDTPEEAHEAYIAAAKTRRFEQRVRP